MDDDLSQTLLDLHAEYAAAVNNAIAEDRFELVDQLADEFSSVALEVMSRGDRAA